MKLAIGIADRVIGINLLGEAEQAVPLFKERFKGYLCPERERDGELKIGLLKYPHKTPQLIKLGQKGFIEQRLPTKNVKAWLEKIPGQAHDFPITETTIASFFLTGLLLFNPESSAGCLLLRDGKGCLWPVDRLCWMFLAQALGEQRGCFVHSAALARNDRGYLFIGPSGAGKSTLAKTFGGSMVFSDESPVLSERQGDFFLSPSPYRQTGALQDPAGSMIGLNARVEGIYFILKDRRTYLEKLSKREALAQIMNRHILFIQYLSARARAHLFNLFFDACDRIPLYNLHVCLDEDIWRAIDASERRSK